MIRIVNEQFYILRLLLCLTKSEKTKYSFTSSLSWPCLLRCNHTYQTFTQWLQAVSYCQAKKGSSLCFILVHGALWRFSEETLLFYFSLSIFPLVSPLMTQCRSSCHFCSFCLGACSQGALQGEDWFFSKSMFAITCFFKTLFNQKRTYWAQNLFFTRVTRPSGLLTSFRLPKHADLLYLTLENCDHISIIRTRFYIEPKFKQP